MRVLLLSCLALLPLISLSPTNGLKIGAFNIQVFGPTKAKNDDVMKTIEKIVSAYDIILIQEIRDATGGCMVDLLELLNEASSEKFAYTVSARLGRSRSKEQYAYYYRVDKVKVIKEHLFNDTDDVFEREPYSVQIEVPTSSQENMKMVLVGVHVKPSDAEAEIDAMLIAYDEFKDVYKTDNMLLMGDMNADCSYMSNAKLQRSKLFSNSDFVSLIGDEEDTTTSQTNCAYDRIFITGNELKSHVFQFGVDHFEETYNLTEEEMKLVSDHFPVWIKVNLQ